MMRFDCVAMAQLYNNLIVHTIPADTQLIRTFLTFLFIHVGKKNFETDPSVPKRIVHHAAAKILFSFD